MAGFAVITLPLTQLGRQQIYQWSSEVDSAFFSLKVLLSAALVTGYLP
jgi:hypothetical protein